MQLDNLCRVWGVAKDLLRKKLMERQDNAVLKEQDFRQMVLDVCNAVGTVHADRLLNANSSYIAKCLALEVPASLS